MKTIKEKMANTELTREIKRVGCCEVSSGTLIRSDLIENFSTALKNLNESAFKQLLTPGHEEITISEDDDGESAEFYLEELISALEQESPEGFYFGANEGDGSCFGFWPIED